MTGVMGVTWVTGVTGVEALLTLGCFSLTPVAPPSHPRDGGEIRVELTMSPSPPRSSAALSLCMAESAILVRASVLHFPGARRESLGSLGLRQSTQRAGCLAQRGQGCLKLRRRELDGLPRELIGARLLDGELELHERRLHLRERARSEHVVELRAGGWVSGWLLAGHRGEAEAR